MAGHQGVWPFLRDVKFRSFVLRRRAAEWLRRHGFPLRMTPQAYAFDRFKRARRILAGGDLSRLRVPAQARRISIVLPVYNGQDYLREALDSIHQQTCGDYELVVVDDGSTDDTPQILDEYARQDPRARVIRQPNLKLPAALSNGFRQARGEFLTWTSADNRLKPCFLEKMLDSLQRHPRWDMIYANEDVIDETGRPLHGTYWYADYQRPLRSEHIHFPADVSELNTRPNNFIGGAFLYRSRVAFLLGNYSPLRFGLEDYDYWMRVNSLLTLRHTDFTEPVYEYRLHGNSLTSRAEELDIRPKLDRLMAFDVFRRRFCLQPMEWRIEMGVPGAPADALAESLRRHVTSLGHRLSDREHPVAVARSVPTVASVYVRIAQTPADATSPPADLPESVSKVLIVVGETPLPDSMPAEWNLCLAWSGRIEPVRLTRPRQGWAATDCLETLVSTIDIRVRSDVLNRIEAEAIPPLDGQDDPAGKSRRAPSGPGALFRQIRNGLGRYRRPVVLSD